MGWVVFWVLVGISMISYFFGAVIVTAALSFSAVVSAFLGGALVLGTASFWLLLLAVTVFASWCVSEGSDSDGDDEPWSLAAAATVVVFGIIIAIANNSLFNLGDYPGWLVAGGVFLAFVAYLALGAAWSRHRYNIFLKKRLAMVESWKTAWFQNGYHGGMKTEQAVADVLRAGKPSDPKQKDYDDRASQYRTATQYKETVEEKLRALRPARNMDRILMWIGLWPWSFVASVLRDPVRMVYEMMLGVYTSLYDKTVGQVEKQFQTLFSDNSVK